MQFEVDPLLPNSCWTLANKMVSVLLSKALWRLQFSESTLTVVTKCQKLGGLNTPSIIFLSSGG